MRMSGWGVFKLLVNGKARVSNIPVVLFPWLLLCRIRMASKVTVTLDKMNENQNKDAVMQISKYKWNSRIGKKKYKERILRSICMMFVAYYRKTQVNGADRFTFPVRSLLGGADTWWGNWSKKDVSEEKMDRRMWGQKDMGGQIEIVL